MSMMTTSTTTSPPRMTRAPEAEPEENDAGVGAPPTASTPSEGPFDGETDGDAYFVEAEGMSGYEEEERDDEGSTSIRQTEEPLGGGGGDDDDGVDDDDEVRLVDDDVVDDVDCGGDDDDADDDEKRKENLDAMRVNGREERAKFFVTNRVPANDLIRN